MTEFPSHRRTAFNGLALAIVKSKDSVPGVIRLEASAKGLEGVSVRLESGLLIAPKLLLFRKATDGRFNTIR